jgi:NAD dependent epimerase/dehydratase family enzyme
MNVTTPWPVTNGDFTKRLAKSLGRPAIFRAPAFALKLVLRGFADELLWSRRVLPAVATEHGFGFQFPELTDATFADA